MAKRFSEQTKEKARAMRASGMTYIKIAEEIGCTAPCVRYWCDVNARANNGGKADENWVRKTYQEGYETHMSNLKRCGSASASISQAEHMAIISLYTACKKLSQESGYPHEVDHIKPVSKGGEHRIWNLRILPRHMNRRGRGV